MTYNCSSANCFLARVDHLRLIQVETPSPAATARQVVSKRLTITVILSRPPRSFASVTNCSQANRGSG